MKQSKQVGKMLVSFFGSISSFPASTRRCVLWTLLASVFALFVASGVCFAQRQDYLLGPEDVVTITVVGHAEYSGDFYIPTDGLVDFPGAGPIKVAGKTLGQLSQEVTLSLEKKLKEPDVAVTLKSPRAQVVYVLGDVGKPGTYSIKPGWRITEVLSAAGGLGSSILPADCSATVLRASTGTKETLSLTKALSGDVSNNVPVFSGDVVTIDSVELVPVYVMGKVRNPGLYRLRRDAAGIVEALSMAGGSLPESALSKITVTRLSGVVDSVDLSPIMVDGKQPKPYRLESGDLIVVPESSLRIAVLGWVKNPGVYPLTETKVLSLADAVGVAGGVDSKRGELRQVAILRTSNGKQERRVMDLSKFLKSADITQNPAIQPGDVIWVPETTRPDWEMIFRALSTTALLITPINKL